MAAAAGGMAPPLTGPRIYGDDDDTLFRLIAIGNAKVWVRSASHSLIQMGDAKTHRWMMPKHG